MVTARINYKKWPRLLQILFLAFGFLFISLSLIILLRVILEPAIPLPRVIGNSIPNTEIIVSMSFWADMLVSLLTIQTISLTLKQGKNLRNVVASVLFGLIGVLLVIALEVNRLYIRQIYNLLFLELNFSDTEHALKELLDLLPFKASIDTTVLIITAVSGLITALTGLYGQIISSRKIKVELQLAKQQLLLEQKKIDLEASKQNKEK